MIKSFFAQSILDWMDLGGKVFEQPVKIWGRVSGVQFFLNLITACYVKLQKQEVNERDMLGKEAGSFNIFSACLWREIYYKGPNQNIENAP